MFEQLRNRLAAEAGKLKKDSLEVELVQPEDIPSLNLSWNSHFNTPTLRQHLQEFPGLSLRVRGQADYIIGDKWRRRNDIGQLTETRSRHYKLELVNGLLEEYRRKGYQAVVVGADEQNENQKFYDEAGFSELERIVYYEKPDVKVPNHFDHPPVTLRPYSHSEAVLADWLAVDNASFPWLWWNSRAELEFYRKQEGVTIQLAYQSVPGGTVRPVGYFGYTLYERWAHLDRLAVIPDLHGQHIGAYLLAAALGSMAERGARRVTLSTQHDNYKSQRLYEGFGFQKVKTLEYSLIGKWLARPAV